MKPTDTTSRHTLLLPGAARDTLERLARGAYPEEGCGLLLGTHTATVTLVREVTRARNLDRSRARDRYQLDPADQLRAEERAETLGLAVVGVWHSHPDHPAVPSETDRAAAWEGWSYVIASVHGGAVTDVRSWRLVAGAFEEESLEP